MKTYLFALLVLLSTTPDRAYGQACDCVPPSSANDAKKNSTLVFSGDVLAKEIISLPQVYTDYREYFVKFRMKRSWKGEAKREIMVRTPATQEACGFKFNNGESYLVYGSGANVPLVTFCSRTVLLNTTQAEGDQIQMGKGTLVKSEE